MDATRILHKAAEDGDLAMALSLLKDDPYLVGSREDYRLTPLHRAAMAGHADVAEALLARSAAVDARDYGGGTALHGAAAHGRSEAAAVLLARGADPNLVNEEGHSPLHLAARGGHEAAAAVLLDKGADPNLRGEFIGTPLHEAAERGHLGMVRLLLARGGLANARSGGSHEALTPWHAARQAGHGDIADLLESHGGRDKAALAITLHRAAEFAYLGRLQVLLKEDPSLIGTRDYLYRRTPLHFAAEHGHRPAAELLLAAGADVAARDKNGDTPLDRAEAMGHQDLAELLRRHGREG
ncbi:MAG TPA: ankyrin repeat domain-containing protein [Caulobacteraceae bacterium]|jgi:ankyrin repeat protein